MYEGVRVNQIILFKGFFPYLWEMRFIKHVFVQKTEKIT